MSGASLAEARARYASDLRRLAGLRSQAVIDAFATVPRERFLGAGPWTLPDPGTETTTSADDPRDLYQNVLVAIDADRGINNGQPSLWAHLLDQLALIAGQHVVHVGAGTGYYTAIMAEIVGSAGSVVAIEIDPDLAGKARRNLTPWPNARLVEQDGFQYLPDPPADAIVINAGVTHLPPGWLDGLAPEGGRLLVPFTTADWRGGFLQVTRRNAQTRRYPVRYASWTGIIPCVGGRNAQAEHRLEAALARSDLAAVRSLRRAPEEPDASCWLAGDGWWLSTEPVPDDTSPPPFRIAGLPGIRPR